MSKKKRTVCFDTKISWLNIARMYNAEAEQYGLSVSAAFLLLHLNDEGTQVTQLAPLLGMEASSMTRILNNIEERGWIERRRFNNNDRRAVKIFLTPSGIEAREIAKEKVRHFNKKVQEHTKPDDLDAFFRVIDTMNDLISNNQIFETSNSSVYNETNH
ncbi:MAG: MarR family winged helix-turn-helix transcriptional regulator [Bacteroidia bacterium]